MDGYIFLALEWAQDYWLRAFLADLFYGLLGPCLALCQVVTSVQSLIL